MIKDRRGKQITIERCGGQRKKQWIEVSKMVRERRGGKGDGREEWWTGEVAEDGQTRQLVGRSWTDWGWVRDLEMPSTGEEEIRGGQSWLNVLRLSEVE